MGTQKALTTLVSALLVQSCSVFSERKAIVDIQNVYMVNSKPSERYVAIHRQGSEKKVWYVCFPKDETVRDRYDKLFSAIEQYENGIRIEGVANGAALHDVTIQGGKGKFTDTKGLYVPMNGDGCGRG